MLTRLNWQDHAHLGTQREFVSQVVPGGKGVECPVDEPVLEVHGNGRLGRRDPPGRVGGHLTEFDDDLVAYLVVCVKDRLFRLVQIVAGAVEDRFKLGKRLPRNPPVSGRLE